MNPAPPEAVSLPLLFQSLRRWWWVVAGCLLTTVLLGLGYLSIATPIYEAQARVLIQRRNLALQLSSERVQEKEFIATQAEVIRSPLTVHPALEQVPFTPLELEAEDPIAALMEELRVNPLVTTDILRVSYRHSDPEIAAGRLQAILDSYRQQLREQEKNSATNLVLVLSRREEQLRGQLRELQNQYAELRASSPATGQIQESLSTETEPLKSLSDRLAEIQARRIQLETALEQQLANANASNAALIGSWDPDFQRGLQELQSDLRDATAEQARLERFYGRQHPRWQAAQARVTQLQSDYQRYVALSADSLRQRLDSARAEERQVVTALGSERTRVKGLDNYALREAQLQQEIEQVRALHTTTSESLQTLKLTDQTLADGRASIAVQVLDDFIVPDKPLWPQPVPFLAISVFVGLLVGLVAVYLLAMWPLLTAAATPASAAPVVSSEDQSLQVIERQLKELQASLPRQQPQPVSRPIREPLT